MYSTRRVAMPLEIHLMNMAALPTGVVLVISSLLLISLQSPAFAVTKNVDIVQGASSKTTDAYSPNPVKIRVGDTVVWTNKDATFHSATSGTSASGPTGLFGGTAESPNILSPMGTQSFTFTQRGVYPYYCVIHPNMVGKVIVGTLISIDNVAKTEGDSGTKSFIFTVTRSGITSGSSSLNFATASGTATAGSDYVSKSGTLSFASGETTKTIAIQVKGDTLVEANERFRVNLSNCVGCSFLDNLGLGTIKNDDP